jgi:hypothetical protein
MPNFYDDNHVAQACEHIDFVATDPDVATQDIEPPRREPFGDGSFGPSTTTHTSGAGPWGSHAGRW